MLSDFLKNNITSQAKFIAGDGTASHPATGYGYGQVEPNHLSAQRTAQVYAQLPAAADITILEQGQFVKYDYANGVCNFGGTNDTTYDLGEWMLVFNEIKLYRENQMDCEFAMIKDNYQARVYSPFGGDRAGNPDTASWNKQSRYYNGVDSQNNTGYTFGATEAVYTLTSDVALDNTKTYYTKSGSTYTEVSTPDVDDIATYYEMTAPANAGTTYNYDDVTAGADYYEPHYNADPFHIESYAVEKMMPTGTQMVPRVFKTNVGDIYTTNTINELPSDISVGTKLYVGNKGLLTKTKKNNPDANGAASGDMVWQVVKIYTMPDHQPGVKIMRIA